MGISAASRSTATLDDDGLPRRNAGSLFTGFSTCRGDIGDELAPPARPAIDDDGEAGNEPAVTAPVVVVVVAVTWERANGDGVCWRAWCMREVWAAARAAIELERGLGSVVEGGRVAATTGTCGILASSRLQKSELSLSTLTNKKKVCHANLFSFCCAAGIAGESKPENERERGRNVAVFGIKFVLGMTLWF